MEKKRFRAAASLSAAFRPLLQAGFGRERIDQVLAFYDESHRRYHNRAHVLEMLDIAHATDFELSVCQVLAILFHDAIYVPGAPRGANEKLSAQLLRTYAADLDDATVSCAMAIVLDTIDHAARSAESRLVVDLDLLSLGAAPARFKRMTEAVFAEQQALWRSDTATQARHRFEVQRARFFRSLLRRPAIYATPALHARYEVAARANLMPVVERFRARN
jgi:predicted metal-dependent HD superfamily phosphohydrolase